MKIRLLPALVLLVLVAPTQATAQSLNDAQVAHAAVTANQIDIANAELALERAADSEVRRFAETMIQDHEAVIDQAVALAEELGVTPEDNHLSRALLAGNEEVRDRLSGLRGRAFELAYIEHEIAFHQAVIEAVREVLIPETTVDPLADLLEAVLPALEAHLEHARTVQAGIEDG